jgi:heme exporter protein A
MYSLKLREIRKHYSNTLLFNNISFELRSGDVLAITGWNGSGKSTLLRIIAGLVRPSSGQINMSDNGKPIPPELRRTFIGMASPAISLYDELTGIENISFFSKVRGLAWDKKSCLSMMKNMGLHRHAHKIYNNYSSGMKQRLKLVQAVIHKPPLLLLDEPGSNLDAKGMQIIRQIILNQRQAGITIIASNEQREVDYANRIINLSE